MKNNDFLKFLLVTLSLIPYLLSGQSISVELPILSGEISTFQLKQIIIINNGTAKKVNIEIEIYGNSQKPIISYFGSGLSIRQGGNVIGQANLNDEHYIYSNVYEAQYFKHSSFLPPGNYILKVNVFDFIDGSLLAEATLERPVKTLASPLQLTYPGNRDLINTTQPVFNWIPPTPVDISNIKYRLIIKEKNSRKGIIKRQGIADIYPLLTNSFLYEDQKYNMKYDSTYQWEVIAFNDGFEISRSDIWEFTPHLNEPKARGLIAPNLNTKKDTSTIYWILSDKLDAGYYVAEGKCCISFKNLSYDTALNYKIFNSSSNSSVASADMPLINIKYGENNTTIPLQGNSQMIDGNEYLLSIQLSNGKRFRLKFLYKN